MNALPPAARHFVGALLLLSLPWCMAGCGNGRPRADLVFANGAEVETLDPALITAQIDMRLSYALFEGLTTFNRAGEPVPGVAERWDISPDGTVYTFHLRRDALWTNGQRVTARDFVNAWRRVLSPETASEYAYQLFYLKNGQRFNDPDRAFHRFLAGRRPRAGRRHAPGRTRARHALFPRPLRVDHAPAPSRADRRNVGATPGSSPSTSFPTARSRSRNGGINDHIRLQKNPRYWGRDTVRLNTVDMLPISQSNVALNFFAAGTVRPHHGQGPDARRASSANCARSRISMPRRILGNFFVRFNCTRPPFNDPRVRQAFALVVDKKLLTEKITKAGEPPAYLVRAAGHGRATSRPRRGWVTIPSARGVCSPTRGFPAGKVFRPCRSFTTSGEQNQYIGVELKSMFERELGVSMSLRPQENKVYLHTMSTLDYDLARSSWIGDYNDPNTFLDMWVSGGGNNRCGWSDPRYDALIAQAARELDREQRFDLFRRAEQILVSEQTPICPLYLLCRHPALRRRRLGGVEPNLLDAHPLREMY